VEGIHQCALVGYLKEVEKEHKDELRAMLGLPWLEWSKVPGPRRGEETFVLGHKPLEATQGPAYMQQDQLMPKNRRLIVFSTTNMSVSEVFIW